jgi:hypothetical protein
MCNPFEIKMLVIETETEWFNPFEEYNKKLELEELSS